MPSPIAVTRTIASHCFLPIACSVVVGLFFAGAYVFDRSYPAFQFVMTPIVASVYYYLLVFRKPREAHAGLFVLLFLTVLTTESTETAFLLRDFWYVAAIGAGMFTYWKYFRQAGFKNVSSPAVVLAGLYGIANIIVSLIHLWIMRLFELEFLRSSYSQVASNAAFFGVLIGSAVGLGIGLSGQLLEKRS